MTDHVHVWGDPVVCANQEPGTPTRFRCQCGAWAWRRIDCVIVLYSEARWAMFDETNGLGPAKGAPARPRGRGGPVARRGPITAQPMSDTRGQHGGYVPPGTSTPRGRR